MELKSLDGLTLGSIIAGVAASILVIVTTKLKSWAQQNRLLGRLFFYVINDFYFRTAALLLISFVMSLVIGVAVKRFASSPDNPYLDMILSFVILLLVSEWQLCRVGFNSGQLSVRFGTNYEASLNLCRNEFAFLGTGAFKVTNAASFQQTMLRCSHGKVRFLLSSPENEVIAEAEKRANQSPGTYAHNVRTSLNVLKQLREDRGLDFEVKFYEANSPKDFESFRMMFIDDSILLISYNVYGRGDGSKTPQVVLFNPRFVATSDSFYHAFKSYYENLWASSTYWDFEKYV